MSVSRIPQPVQLAAGVILILFSLNVISRAQGIPRDEILRNCETCFGPRVGYSPVLFEIDRHYVLNIKFDSKGELEVVAVEPKYYYGADRPEWEKTIDFKWLSQDQISDLLSRIGKDHLGHQQNGAVHR